MINPYLIVPFLTWIITQFLKFVIAASRGKLDFRYLYASGGMPSVHSAVVTSLATTAFLVDGPQSSAFGITAILAGIVMYDSFGVRRASGEQAAAINLIIDSLNQDHVRLAHPQQRLREILGHKPLEVTIGAVIGFLLAGLLNIDRLGPLLALMTSPLPRQSVLIWVGASLLVVVASLVMRLLYLGKFRKIAVIEAAIKRCFWVAFSVGVVSLLTSLLALEKVAVALWVIWPLLILVVGIVLAAWLYSYYRPKIVLAMAENRTQIDKQKWFEGPNKKRRAAKARSKKRK